MQLSPVNSLSLSCSVSFNFSNHASVLLNSYCDVLDQLMDRCSVGEEDSAAALMFKPLTVFIHLFLSEMLL